MPRISYRRLLRYHGLERSELHLHDQHRGARGHDTTGVPTTRHQSSMRGWHNHTLRHTGRAASKGRYQNTRTTPVEGRAPRYGSIDAFHRLLGSRQPRCGSSC